MCKPHPEGKIKPGVSTNQSMNQNHLSEELFAENAADTLERVFLVYWRLAFHLCFDVGPDLLQRGSVLCTSEVHLESQSAGFVRNTVENFIPSVG